MNKIKIFFLSFALTVVVVSGLSPKTYSFDLFSRTCSGDIVDNNANTKSSTCKDNTSGKKHTASNNGVIQIIKALSNIIAVITGVLAVIYIILGGFLLATAGGNAENIAAARRRIIAALIGLVIVALAWTITRFIVEKVIQ